VLIRKHEERSTDLRPIARRAASDRISWRQVNGEEFEGRCFEVDANVGHVRLDDGTHKAVELELPEIERLAAAGVDGASDYLRSNHPERFATLMQGQAEWLRDTVAKGGLGLGQPPRRMKGRLFRAEGVDYSVTSPAQERAEALENAPGLLDPNTQQYIEEGLGMTGGSGVPGAPQEITADDTQPMRPPRPELAEDLQLPEQEEAYPLGEPIEDEPDIAEGTPRFEELPPPGAVPPPFWLEQFLKLTGGEIVATADDVDDLAPTQVAVQFESQAGAREFSLAVTGQPYEAEIMPLEADVAADLGDTPALVVDYLVSREAKKLDLNAKRRVVDAIITKRADDPTDEDGEWRREPEDGETTPEESHDETTEPYGDDEPPSNLGLPLWRRQQKRRQRFSKKLERGDMVVVAHKGETQPAQVTRVYVSGQDVTEHVLDLKLTKSGQLVSGFPEGMVLMMMPGSNGEVHDHTDEQLCPHCGHIGCPDLCPAGCTCSDAMGGGDIIIIEIGDLGPEPDVMQPGGGLKGLEGLIPVEDENEFVEVDGLDLVPFADDDMMEVDGLDLLGPIDEAILDAGGDENDLTVESDEAPEDSSQDPFEPGIESPSKAEGRGEMTDTDTADSDEAAPTDEDEDTSASEDDEEPPEKPDEDDEDDEDTEPGRPPFEEPEDKEARRRFHAALDRWAATGFDPEFIDKDAQAKKWLAPALMGLGLGTAPVGYGLSQMQSGPGAMPPAPPAMTQTMEAPKRPMIEVQHPEAPPVQAPAIEQERTPAPKVQAPKKRRTKKRKPQKLTPEEQSIEQAHDFGYSYDMDDPVQEHRYNQLKGDAADWAMQGWTKRMIEIQNMAKSPKPGVTGKDLFPDNKSHARIYDARVKRYSKGGGLSAEAVTDLDQRTHGLSEASADQSRVRARLPNKQAFGQRERDLVRHYVHKATGEAPLAIPIRDVVDYSCPHCNEVIHEKFGSRWDRDSDAHVCNKCGGKFHFKTKQEREADAAAVDAFFNRGASKHDDQTRRLYKLMMRRDPDRNSTNSMDIDNWDYLDRAAGVWDKSPKTYKVEHKPYRCTLCGHEQDISTNHYGNVYSQCKGCSWKSEGFGPGQRIGPGPIHREFEYAGDEDPEKTPPGHNFGEGDVEASRHVAFEDRLPGGLADDKAPDEFDPAELSRGIEHEMEHVDDAGIAQEIAMDHLVEDDLYYTHLEDMEREGDADTGLERQEVLAPQHEREELGSIDDPIEQPDAVIETPMQHALDERHAKSQKTYGDVTLSILDPGEGGSSEDVAEVAIRVPHSQDFVRPSDVGVESFDQYADPAGQRNPILMIPWSELPAFEQALAKAQEAGGAVQDEPDYENMSWQDCPICAVMTGHRRMHKDGMRFEDTPVSIYDRKNADINWHLDPVEDVVIGWEELMPERANKNHGPGRKAGERKRAALEGFKRFAAIMEKLGIDVDEASLPHIRIEAPNVPGVDPEETYEVINHNFRTNEVTLKPTGGGENVVLPEQTIEDSFSAASGIAPGSESGIPYQFMPSEPFQPVERTEQEWEDIRQKYRDLYSESPEGTGVPEEDLEDETDTPAFGAPAFDPSQIPGKRVPTPRGVDPEQGFVSGPAGGTWPLQEGELQEYMQAPETQPGVGPQPTTGLEPTLPSVRPYKQPGATQPVPTERWTQDYP
jgi:hypothetical protein